LKHIGMARNLTGPRMSQATAPQSRRALEYLGPQLGFAATMLAGAAAWIAAQATLPPDAVMPMVSTLLLVLAGAFGLIAWRHRPMNPGNVTYRDVAGALTLIGLCAAATIDSDQMMRLAQLQTGRTE
jgi:protein-S-isoprenylcysteine O-methyltransferase Ste14